MEIKCCQIIQLFIGQFKALMMHSPEDIPYVENIWKNPLILWCKLYGFSFSIIYWQVVVWYFIFLTAVAPHDPGCILIAFSEFPGWSSRQVQGKIRCQKLTINEINRFLGSKQ